MALPEPVSMGPVVFCTTEHLDRYDLAGDRQVDGVLKIARHYRDVQDERIGRLGVLLLPKRQAESLTSEGVPRVCRDALALCYITNGVAHKSVNSSFPAIVASDYFDMWPMFIDGNTFTIRSPGLIGLGYDVWRYKPVEPLHLPPLQPDDAEFYDEQLFAGLDKAIRGFISGKNKRVLRQVFRAIAIAYHASRQLHEADSYLHDLGTRIVHWISAFETLVHPGKGHVELKDVLSLVDAVKWPVLGRATRMGRRVRRSYSVGYRRYTWSYRGKHGKEHAACHYYRQLFNLRNALAHGNAISRRQFRVLQRPKGWRIDLPTPLLFRECLMERLRPTGYVPIHATSNLSSEQYRDFVDAQLAQNRFDKALARMLLRPRRP